MEYPDAGPKTGLCWRKFPLGLNQDTQPRKNPPDNGEQSIVHPNENFITEKVNDNEFQYCNRWGYELFY